MTSASQAQKLQVHGVNSEGVWAPVADTAIASFSDNTVGTITPVDGAAAFSNAAAVNTHNATNIIYTFGTCPGLSINASTGSITGTPTAAGVYKCKVTAHIDGGAVDSNIFTITIT